MERDRIEATLFPEGDSSLDREFVGTSPATIADAADVPADEPAFLVVEAAGIGPEHPLSGEKLAPIVTAHEAASFEAALERTRRLLEYEGTGHSCTIHTEEDQRARHAGRDFPVCRLAINQSGLGPAGTADNGLHTTYSLGGGPWAGNQLDENLSSEQFISSTRIARLLDRTAPGPEDLFDSIVDN